MSVTWNDIQRVTSEATPTTIEKGGKSNLYITVAERIKAFRKLYPDGFIKTEMISNTDGVCTIKASVGYYREDGSEVILGTGTASEKESSSFINKTSYIENCVPLNTQILTAEGWKYYYQLQPFEMVWSLNLETKEVELCKLLGVNLYKDRPIVQLSTSRFSALCTPQHKWIVKTQYKDLYKEETESLSNSEKIVQAVKQTAYPSRTGRRLGWLMCDCDVKYCSGMASGASINQSKHVRDVEDLFGKGTRTKKYVETNLDNYEWYISAHTVRSILGAFGMASYRDLPKAMSKADINDVMGCYNSMMLADGDHSGFSSTYPELIEGMQIICARLGIATGKVRSRMCAKSTRPIYTLPIKKTDGSWFSEMKVKKLPPRDVWCPTTGNGTWFMRQDGMVSLTSNCESSSIGRAIGMTGIGILSDIASAEEVLNADLNYTANSLISGAKVKALEARCKKCGVSITDLCVLYKVKTLDELTERKYINIHENWDKIEMGYQEVKK